MSDNIKGEAARLNGVLQQVAGQLKGSLGNIHSALERIAPPEARDGSEALDADAAVLCQSYYRILRLANNLTDAADLEAVSPVSLRNDDIIGFCRQMLQKAEHSAQLLGLELTFSAEKTSHIIAMNADRLERLMMNLLSNSFKFTPKGGKIHLEVKIGMRTVELHLTDTGVGIAPELMDTVFDRYRQPDRMDPPPHGLGLGLPICRKIAREHGGNILLTSQPGQGTAVVVSLPNEKSPIHELHSFVIDYAGGFNRTLVELSDALPRQAFSRKFLD